MTAPASLVYISISDSRLVTISGGLPDAVKEFCLPLTSSAAYWENRIPTALPWCIQASNITKVSVLYFHSSWFSELPCSLTDLTIEVLKVPTAPLPDIFAALPSGLEIFSVTVHQKTHDLLGPMDEKEHPLYPSTCFSHMRSLKSLRVTPAVGCFQSAILRSLSPTLRNLWIDILSLEEADLPFIPPLLTSFSFHTAFRAPLVDDIVDYWPVRAVQALPSTQAHLREKVKSRVERWLGRTHAPSPTTANT